MVLDSITDTHLDIVGQAVCDMPLVTGGSGLGVGIARALKKPDQADAEDAAKAGRRPTGAWCCFGRILFGRDQLSGCPL